MLLIDLILMTYQLMISLALILLIVDLMRWKMRVFLMVINPMDLDNINRIRSKVNLELDHSGIKVK